MKIKNLIKMPQYLILSIISLLAFSGAGLLATTNNVFALDIPSPGGGGGVSCYWVGTGSGNWSDTSDWADSAGGTGGTCADSNSYPTGTDVAYFDNTLLTGNSTVTVNVTSLTLNGIVFSGSNSGGYNFTLSGSDSINLSGGIDDLAASNNLDYIDVNLTLGADSFIADTAGAKNLIIGSGSTTLDLSTYNLELQDAHSLSGGGAIQVNAALDGSGNITVDSGSGDYYYFGTAASSYSGDTSISGYVQISDPAALGSGTITVNGGGSLKADFTSSAPTLANDINVDGTGQSGIGGSLVFNDDCTNYISCNNDGTDTLSGTITLAGDTTFYSGGDAVALTGTLTCSTYTITTAGSGTFTGIPSGCTPTSGSATTAAAPKAPDTGSGLFSSDVVLPIIGGLLSASGLYYLSRKTNLFAKR